MALHAPVSVHLLPSLIPPGALRGGVAVVIDVLRATTVMAYALQAGCEAVIPCAEIEEAEAVAASLPPGAALLGGERGGLPIAGFDLGNSPGDYTPERCRGKTLVITTTNGTRAILASLEADRVLVASFANLRATARVLKEDVPYCELPRPVHLVCAGTEGAISLEDTLLAGALYRAVEDRIGPGTPLGNDAAWLATAIPPDDPAYLDAPLVLTSLLRAGRGGQNVDRLGLGRDIDFAARVDTVPFAVELRRDPLRLVRADVVG
jgi:2-phosphosulfolactate phosphatase